MDQTMTIFALCFFLQTSAFIHPNGSMPLLRTFAGHYVTGEPIMDYFDELDNASGNTGSGMEQPQVEKPTPRNGHRHPARKYYQVSPEAKGFLQGPLSTIMVPTIYAFVFATSLPLNLAAVLMFLRRKGPRKTAVIYMLNLACADLLFVLLLPLKIAYHYHGNNWVFGAALCRVVTAAFYCNMYCSVLLMTCISVDRFLAVVYPMDALTWRSPRAAYASCTTMWLLAVGGVAPLLLSEQSLHLPDLGVTTCHDVQDEGQLRSYYLYFFPVYISLFFFLPLVFTSACYVRIVLALAAANVDNRSRKGRAVVMALAVLVVFVACFGPSNVLMVVHYAQLARNNNSSSSSSSSSSNNNNKAAAAAADTSYRAYLVATCVGTLSCCLDPLIYYFGSSQYQRKVAALLTCRGPAGRGPGGSSRSQSRSRSSGSQLTLSTKSTQMESLQATALGAHYRKLIS